MDDALCNMKIDFPVVYHFWWAFVLVCSGVAKRRSRAKGIFIAVCLWLRMVWWFHYVVTFPDTSAITTLVLFWGAICAPRGLLYCPSGNCGASKQHWRIVVYKSQDLTYMIIWTRCENSMNHTIQHVSTWWKLYHNGCHNYFSTAMN